MAGEPCFFPGPSCPRIERAEHEWPSTVVDSETGAVWCSYCPSQITRPSPQDQGAGK